MGVSFHATIPILRIFDIPKALGFYRDYLGFQVDWDHRFEPGLPVYMQVSRGGCVLHLTEHHGDCCPGSTVFLRMQGLRELHAELTTRDYPFLRPGLDWTAWGSLGMEVVDPFGNRLRFDESSTPKIQDP